MGMENQLGIQHIGWSTQVQRSSTIFYSKVNLHPFHFEKQHMSFSQLEHTLKARGYFVDLWFVGIRHLELKKRSILSLNKNDGPPKNATKTLKTKTMWYWRSEQMVPRDDGFSSPKWWAIFGTPESSKSQGGSAPHKTKTKKDLPTTLFWGGKDLAKTGEKRGNSLWGKVLERTLVTLTKHGKTPSRMPVWTS